MSKEQSPDDRDSPPSISFLFTDQKANDAFATQDAAIIRSLTLLFQATGHDFADH